MTSCVDRPPAEGAPAPDGPPASAGPALSEAPALCEPPALRRPNLSGDLLRTLTHAPVFRRAPIGGYDRFQVDAYVQWAEDELASAGRQRAELVAHLVQARADLDEARRLLEHSPAGAEFLRLSRRMGVLLASAADQADGLRAEGEAEHAAAVARAHRLVDTAVADGERVIAEAAAEAGRLVTEANAEAQRVAAGAGRLLAEAEQTEREARAEAAARLERARAIEDRAHEEAARLRAAAAEEAAAARLQARADVVRLLEDGRQQRRRSDDEAAAVRARADREADARRAALVAEIKQLDRRRARATRSRERTPDEVPVPREPPAEEPRPEHSRSPRVVLHLPRRHAR